MIFKTIAIKDSFPQLNPNLKVIAFAMDGYMRYHFATDLFITSMIRDNSKTHARGDAFDFRAVDMTKEQFKKLVEWVNKRFDYGDGFKTIIDEWERPKGSVNWTAPHGHAQANWRNRGRAWY